MSAYDFSVTWSYTFGLVVPLFLTQFPHLDNTSSDSLVRCNQDLKVKILSICCEFLFGKSEGLEDTIWLLNQNNQKSVKLLSFIEPNEIRKIKKNEANSSMCMSNNDSGMVWQ